MVVANKAHAHVPNVYPYPGRQPDYTARTRAKKSPLVNVGLIRRVMAGLLVVSLALLVIFRYGQISQVNMDINRDTNTRNALADEQRHLGITIANLTALERLEKIALGEFGMQYPHPEQFKFVGDNYPESGDGDGE